MKRLFFCLVIMIMALAATAQSTHIKGRIIGLKNEPIVFNYTQQGSQRSDTVWAKEDRFAYNPKPSDDGRIILIITYPRFTSFWYEPGDITITGSIDKPYELQITGTPENNVANQFRQDVEWAYEGRRQRKAGSAELLSSQQRQATLTFIKNHPTTRTSAYLLYREAFVDHQRVTQYQQLYKQLTPIVQASYYGRSTAHHIQNVLNQPVIGRQAPSFSLADTTGTLFSLDSYRGRYVLLDFWGHWCPPCLQAFKQLKIVKATYANKLTIIGVAAEATTDREKWTHAIRKYDADWLQLSELKGDKGLVNEQYNVIDFPTYFLLDQDGIVIERSKRLESIEQKLATLPNIK